MLNASLAGLSALAEGLTASFTDVSGADIPAAAETVETVSKYAYLFEDKGTLISVVTLTGIVVVFFALFLLILIFGIFGLVDKAKKPEKPEKPAQPVSKSAESPKAEAPYKPQGVPGEVIAAISAAVAYMGMQDGKSYAVRSVRRAAQPQGRPAWSNAAIIENTRPF